MVLNKLSYCPSVFKLVIFSFAAIRASGSEKSKLFIIGYRIFLSSGEKSETKLRNRYE